MTMVGVPDYLLTLEEWDELPEDTYRRAELAEGILQVGPSPTVRHQVMLTGLMVQLVTATVGSGLTVIPDIDVLIDGAFPATVRQPDISVVRQGGADANLKRLASADVVLAVEIVSPGSGRRDRVTKLSEYAEARIPHYWIVTTDGPVIGLDTFLLEGDTYSRLKHAEGGTVTITEPFAVTLDLDALRIW
jgi:Uma2 family endonuclease